MNEANPHSVLELFNDRLRRPEVGNSIMVIDIAGRAASRLGMEAPEALDGLKSDVEAGWLKIEARPHMNTKTEVNWVVLTDKGLLKLTPPGWSFRPR